MGKELGGYGAVAQSLIGLFGVHFVRGDTSRSLTFVEEALEFAQRDTLLLSAGHLAVAGSLTSLGRVEEACEHFERSREYYDEKRSRSLVSGSDAETFSRAWEAHALWLRGFPERAARRSREAIAKAERLGNPYNLVLANAYGAITLQLLEDEDAALGCADRARSLADTYGFAYYGEWGSVVRGWVRAERGHEEGTADIHKGLALVRSRR